MIRLAEIGCFLALALAVHIGLAIRFDPADGADAGGMGGDTMVTLAAASARIEAMVENWDRPPETQTDPVPLQISPPSDTAAPVSPVAIATPAPALAPPPMAPSPVALPDHATIDTATAPPPKPVNDLRPVARPEPRVVEPAPAKPAPVKPTPTKPKKQSASSASTAQKSAGTGGTSQAGTTGTSSVKTATKAQKSRALAAWGGQIRTRIERRKRNPAGNRAKGRVMLRLTVTPAGSVTGASVTRSSGSPALDRAALAAVSRAGRMPRAPAALTAASYRFNLPIDFR